MNHASRLSIVDDYDVADATSAEPRLVFLVGLPRSGTTWLQKLLGNHPQIGTAQESH